MNENEKEKHGTLLLVVKDGEYTVPAYGGRFPFLTSDRCRGMSPASVVRECLRKNGLGFLKHEHVYTARDGLVEIRTHTEKVVVFRSLPEYVVNSRDRNGLVRLALLAALKPAKTANWWSTIGLEALRELRAYVEKMEWGQASALEMLLSLSEPAPLRAQPQAQKGHEEQAGLRMAQMQLGGRLERSSVGYSDGVNTFVQGLTADSEGSASDIAARTVSVENERLQVKLQTAEKKIEHLNESLQKQRVVYSRCEGKRVLVGQYLRETVRDLQTQNEVLQRKLQDSNEQAERRQQMIRALQEQFSSRPEETHVRSLETRLSETSEQLRRAQDDQKRLQMRLEESEKTRLGLTDANGDLARQLNKIRSCQRSLETLLEDALRTLKGGETC